MAYTRSKLAGQLQVTAGSTGAGTAPSMPNYGVSIISASSGEAYVLQPPVAGCEKTLVFTGWSTSALPSVRCSTASGVISFVCQSTGLSIMTVAAARSTVYASVVKLRGYNSTSWLIESVFPVTTTPTGAVNGTITLSS